MKFFQLTITTLLKKDMHFSQSSEIIGKSINKAMLKSKELKVYHTEKVYKYVFDNFFPIEQKGLYKENRVYVFNIRSFNEEFIINIKECLRDYNSSYIKVLSIDLQTVKRKHINFLETITPAIVTIDSKPWLSDGNILHLVKRLHANAEKKYKTFFNEEIGEVEDYFIEKLKIINKKPLAYYYKNIKLLANKYRIKVNDDEKSQKLAFAILGNGLAEKNSVLGAGFCSCDWR